MARRTRAGAGIIAAPENPTTVVTRNGPLAGPWASTTWTRGDDGRYRAPGKRPATLDELANRHDQVRWSA